MHIALGTSAFESSNRLFKCPKGHSIRSNVPITIGYYADPNKGPPVCPVCLAEFVREQFPMEEVERVTFVPTATPIIAPLHAPAITMCPKEGCILAKHPDEQPHIGANRQQMQ